MGYEVEFEVVVQKTPDVLIDLSDEWDTLLSHSVSNHVFLFSGWLRSYLEIYGKSALPLIALVRRDGILVAAAPFQARNGIVEFIGSARSDYLDFMLSRDLGPADEVRAIDTILVATKKATPAFRYFNLGRILLNSATATYLKDPQSRFYAIVTNSVEAPMMDIAVDEDRINKTSLRLNEKTLGRLRKIPSNTFIQDNVILPKLDEFFEQHIKRLSLTEYPSLFLHERNREFYRRFTQLLDSTGCLRFTTLELDGRIIAAHFGFCYADRYLYYKPTYDVEYSKHSPGKILLKHLVEFAISDNVAEFNFGIGNEGYKGQFATEVQQAVFFHVTDSLLLSTIERLRIFTKNSAKLKLLDKALNKVSRLIR